MVLRACLNYCLLLDEIGVKCVGPQNPAHYDRLSRHVKVQAKNQNAERLQSALYEYNSYPIKYELAQEVKLYKSVSSTKELSESTGRQVGPHHRRGHYAMQPHGPKSSLRKRIRRPPIFVNADKFFGEMKDTTVRYS
jgi:hypothetical protein